MISVTILTKNSQKYLTQVLESLTLFDEVVIYDSGSTDQTLEIARKFPNVVIYEGKFIGFGPTHNFASSLAKHDWILTIDSDEIMTDELAKEILNLSLNEHCVYSIHRDNFYNGKHILWCGWYPETVFRLYQRKKTCFSDAYIHESIKTERMTKMALHGAVKHYPYETTADFIKKMQSYSELFAEQNQGKKKASLKKAIWHSVYTFFKSYVLKRGFLGGYEGFVISMYNANTAFYKYLKLMEYNKTT